jgi:RNA recognition motif-containing protein
MRPKIKLIKKKQKAKEDAKLLKTNNSHKTVIIKNLKLEITEETLSSFIVEENPGVDIQDIRIVRDRRGASRGYAFVDFDTPKTANKCVKTLNHKTLNGNSITCAISKPPSLGENDKRTIFVNNISFKSTDETISKAFEKVLLSYLVR